MSGPRANYGTMFMVMCDVNASASDSDAIPPIRRWGVGVALDPVD